jgi:hypothetical protein
VAEIITVVVAVTADVVMVKFGEEVAPAATVTVAGTPTPGLLLVKFTTAPEAGAGPPSVTLFSVAETPPTTEVGDRATEKNYSGDEPR